MSHQIGNSFNWGLCDTILAGPVIIGPCHEPTQGAGAGAEEMSVQRLISKHYNMQNENL